MITRTRHPVAAAVALLDEPEVLLAGASADAQAAAHGLEQCDPAEFVTERQRRRLAKKHPAAGRPSARSASTPPGMLAAATSTGGLQGQRPGRVGDSPLIGAGTWADRNVAVSCTGQGEAFIRAGAARLVAALVEHGATLEAAAQAALAAVAECGGNGGLIAVDAGDRQCVDAAVDGMRRCRRGVLAAPGRRNRRARSPNTIERLYGGLCDLGGQAAACEIGESGEPVFGLWAGIPSSYHGGARGARRLRLRVRRSSARLSTEATLVSMFQAIQAGGSVPMARLAWNEPWLIMRALDLGAAGVILPLIDNAARGRARSRVVSLSAPRPAIIRADPRRDHDGFGRPRGPRGRRAVLRDDRDARGARQPRRDRGHARPRRALHRPVGYVARARAASPGGSSTRLGEDRRALSDEMERIRESRAAQRNHPRASLLRRSRRPAVR